VTVAAGLGTRPEFAYPDAVRIGERFPAGGTSEARERPAANGKGKALRAGRREHYPEAEVVAADFAQMRANGGVAGWELPGDSELNLIFETAAYARLASLLVWSVAAAGEGESGWLRERLADMVGWLDDVRPVLPS